MAYKSYDLSVAAYANGFTLWHYTTVDAAATVAAEGYFNDASDMLRVGDMVLANTDTDGTLASGILHVDGNADGTVTVTDLNKAAEAAP